MDIFVKKLKDFLENEGYIDFIYLEELRSEMPSEVREILYNLGEKFESILKRYPDLFELRKYGNGTTKVRLKSYDNKFNNSSVGESLFNVSDDSEKDLYKIAFLTKGALEYVLNEFELGMNEKELREYLNIFYKKNKDKFKISGLNKKGEEYIEFIIKFEDDREITAIFEKNTNVNRPSEQIWALTRWKKVRIRTYLYEFAEFYGFNPKFKNGTEKLQQLVNLAIKENWGKDNIGLVKYIENTFYYLYKNEKEKIVETEDKKYAVFNTGLVSSNRDPIYAFFDKNKSRKKRYYRFRNFCTTKCNGAKEMNDHIIQFPERANYFT